MGKIEKFLIALGTVALFAMVSPEIGIYAIITIIGIPFGYAYWFTPAIFTIFLLAYGIFRFLNLSGRMGALVALLISAIALAIPPYLLNMPINAKANAAVEGDLNNIQFPLRGGVLASRETLRFSKGEAKCGGFCLHALLGGTAVKFLVVDTKSPHDKLTSDTQAVAFRLERRQACPTYSFGAGTHTLKLPLTGNQNVRPADPIETLKLLASNGECLVSELAELGEADLVVSRGKLEPESYNNSKLGFGFFTNTVYADRFAVHQKSANGRFEEIFRNTEVQYKQFAPLLVPIAYMRNFQDADVGWLRMEETLNVHNKYHDPAKWGKFLTRDLGLNLALKGDDTRRKTLDKLQTLLQRGGPPSPVEWELFSQYFDRIGIGHNTKMSLKDFKLGLQMLENPMFPVPPRASQITNFARLQLTDSKFERLIGLLLDRLKNAGSQYEVFGETAASQIKRISLSFKQLPDAAFTPHKDILFSLAKDPKTQRDGWLALKRLSVFGEDAVPPLMDLVKFGTEPKKIFRGDERLKNGFQAGLQGLCNAGLNASSALNELSALAQDRKLPDYGSSGRLLFTTLLRLGGEPATVKAIFEASPQNTSNFSDKRFERFVKRANHPRPPCYY